MLAVAVVGSHAASIAMDSNEELDKEPPDARRLVGSLQGTTIKVYPLTMARYQLHMPLGCCVFVP